MKRSRKKQITRILMAVIALITCICFGTVTVLAEPYYEDTFTFLEKGSLWSAVSVGSDTIYVNGGWLNPADVSFSGVPYRMGQWDTEGFSEKAEAGGDLTVYANFTINADYITVPAGGVLDIKMDWYYNITVDMTVDTIAGTKTLRQVPIIGMKNTTNFMLRNTADKYYIVKPSITDHGIVSGDFWSGNALYKSTVHLSFKNTTNYDLQIHEFEACFEPMKTFYNNNLKEWLQVNNGGAVPEPEQISSIKPVRSSFTRKISMGYNRNSLPSYMVVQPDDVEQYELQNAIGNPSGNDYDDLQSQGDDLNNKIEESNKAEDDLVNDMTDKMEDASDAILDYDTTESVIVSLGNGFNLISDSFDELMDGLPISFNQVVVYAICGGILLALVGHLPGVVDGISKSVERRRAYQESRGIWKNKPEGNPAEWHGTHSQAMREINKFLDD